MMEEQCETLEQKKQFARIANERGGVKYTYGLSYVGEIKYGNGIDNVFKKKTCLKEDKAK